MGARVLEIMLLALLLIVADACPRVRRTHYLLPTTSNGFGNQYYAIEKAAWLADGAVGRQARHRRGVAGPVGDVLRRRVGSVRCQLLPDTRVSTKLDNY